MDKTTVKNKIEERIRELEQFLLDCKSESKSVYDDYTTAQMDCTKGELNFLKQLLTLIGK